MDWLLALLPITVVAAVILFLLRELFEWIRRRSADGRKKEAFRVVLARECELNYWALTRLKSALEHVRSALKEQGSHNFAIGRGDADQIRFEHYIGEKTYSSWPLPPFQSDVMNRIILDVAILDKDLFSTLQSAYDAVANLRHVRQSLIDLISGDQEHLDGFPEYGLREIAEALTDLKKLYQSCTGKKKIPARLR